MKKLTKEQIEEIRRLRLEGKGRAELALMYNVSITCIIYHTEESQNKNMREYQIERYKGLPDKKKKELYLKKKVYLKNYFRERYANDESFREKEKARHCKKKVIICI